MRVGKRFNGEGGMPWRGEGTDKGEWDALMLLVFMKWAYIVQFKPQQ